MVEIGPGSRYEIIKAPFGLAQDKETNSRGMPNFLHGVFLARKFGEVIVLTKPPRAVQIIVFAVRAAIARVVVLRL